MFSKFCFSVGLYLSENSLWWKIPGVWNSNSVYILKNNSKKVLISRTLAEPNITIACSCLPSRFNPCHYIYMLIFSHTWKVNDTRGLQASLSFSIFFFFFFLSFFFFNRQNVADLRVTQMKPNADPPLTGLINVFCKCTKKSALIFNG